MGLPKEVFLSHASADAAFATDIASILRGHGIPVWYSVTNLISGQQWMDEIGAALARCDWFVLIASTQAVESMWVKRELTYALQQQRLENRIVTIRYQSCDLEKLSWVLPSIQYASFEAGLDAGCIDILRTWGIGYDPAKRC
jgi:hypothetical protein